MTTRDAGLGEKVKDGIVGAVKGTGDIAKVTEDVVSNTLATGLNSGFPGY